MRKWLVLRCRRSPCWQGSGHSHQRLVQRPELSKRSSRQGRHRTERTPFSHASVGCFAVLVWWGGAWHDDAGRETSTRRCSNQAKGNALNGTRRAQTLVTQTKRRPDEAHQRRMKNGFGRFGGMFPGALIGTGFVFLGTRNNNVKSLRASSNIVSSLPPTSPTPPPPYGAYRHPPSHQGQVVRRTGYVLQFSHLVSN